MENAASMQVRLGLRTQTARLLGDTLPRSVLMAFWVLWQSVLFTVTFCEVTLSFCPTAFYSTEESF